MIIGACNLDAPRAIVAGEGPTGGPGGAQTEPGNRASIAIRSDGTGTANIAPRRLRTRALRRFLQEPRTAQEPSPPTAQRHPQRVCTVRECQKLKVHERRGEMELVRSAEAHGLERSAERRKTGAKSKTGPGVGGGRCHARCDPGVRRPVPTAVGRVRVRDTTGERRVPRLVRPVRARTHVSPVRRDPRASTAPRPRF